MGMEMGVQTIRKSIVDMIQFRVHYIDAHRAGGEQQHQPSNGVTTDPVNDFKSLLIFNHNLFYYSLLIISIIILGLRSRNGTRLLCDCECVHSNTYLAINF